jgi:crotonobetainyl-CoA:carnitine CoA-transferase CaiB-like acyl-CoA transferase
MILGPLTGVTVVAFEQAVAAPFATRQLADLGARVIKIERNTGDFARNYDTSVNGQSSYHAWLNRSKESVVLDLKSERGHRYAAALIAKADVVIQNLLPGSLERLGLGAQSSLEGNPGLVYLSISGYGSDGPYSQKKAYDLLIQCESGLLSTTGTPDAPAKVGISIADIAAGMYAYSGVLSALLQRQRTGIGSVLEVSMLEALAEWMMQPYLYTEYSGVQPPRTGAAHATIAPYGPYGCRDGNVFLGVQNEREWARFCTVVLEAPGLVEDARFASNSLRVQNRAALDEEIVPRLAAIDAAEVLGRLDAASIANAALRDLHELSAHPQLAARQRWQEVSSPAGPVRILKPPVTAPWDTPMNAIRRVGEQTETVLRELGESIAPESCD